MNTTLGLSCVPTWIQSVWRTSLSTALTCWMFWHRRIHFVYLVSDVTFVSIQSSGHPQELGDSGGMSLQAFEPGRTVCLLPVRPTLLLHDLESRPVLDQVVLTQSPHGVGHSYPVLQLCTALLSLIVEMHPV